MEQAPRTALVIVDVQRGFVAEGGGHLVEAIAAYLDAHRDRYALIIATRFLNHPGSLYESQRDWRAMMGGSPVELLPEIVDRADRILDKSGLAPHRDELWDALDAEAIERVHLCGLDTDQCVLATALLLWDEEMVPTILADLCASSGGEELHDAARAILRRAIGDRNVVRSADLVPDLVDASG
jgi:nicotinamidase-related amidase